MSFQGQHKRTQKLLQSSLKQVLGKSCTLIEPVGEVIATYDCHARTLESRLQVFPGEVGGPSEDSFVERRYLIWTDTFTKWSVA